MKESENHRAPRRHPAAGFVIEPDGQATIVLPDGGWIKVLNEVGARVWDLLDGEQSTEEIIDRVLDEFETTREEAERDVREFIADLEAHHMLESETKKD